MLKNKLLSYDRSFLYVNILMIKNHIVFIFLKKGENNELYLVYNSLNIILYLICNKDQKSFTSMS